MKINHQKVLVVSLGGFEKETLTDELPFLASLIVAAWQRRVRALLHLKSPGTLIPRVSTFSSEDTFSACTPFQYTEAASDVQ
jgi:hypothetical protein